MPQIDFGYNASPLTPAANYAGLYFDSAGTPKYKDPAGNIHPMGGLTGWYDVTAYGVLPGNTAAANVTALNLLLQTTAPAGSTIYFPGGTYNFNAALTSIAKAFTFQGQGSALTGGYSILQITANLAGNFLTLTDGFWYSQFYNLIFTCTVSQTAGAVVHTGSNVGINFTNVDFQGGSSAATLFNCIDYTGAQGANSSVIQTCGFSNFTGIGVTVNGGGSSLVISNSIIQGLWGTATQAATAGISGTVVGALQVMGCDILGAVNNVLINPAGGQVAASVHITNSYFDNALGSNLKITGVGATVRCKFDTCTFTTSSGGTGFSAVELSSTFAYTSTGQAIDFYNCNIVNTFGTTGTTNGFLVSGTAELGLYNCRISNWTNGVQITPIATAGLTKLNIQGCTIGPSAGYAGNGTGILLNAGSATYGLIQIQDNVLTGNTTAPLTDSSTAAVAGQQKLIQGNAGLVNGNAVLTTNVQQNTATEAVLAKVAIPARALRVGSVLRLKVSGLKTTATACNMTVQARYGTAGTTADAIVVAHLAAGTAVANQMFDFEQDLICTTAGASAVFRVATAIFVGSSGVLPLITNVLNGSSSALDSTADKFISLCFLTSAAVTQLDIFKASIEVIQQ